MKTFVAGLILTLAALGPAEQLIAQSPGLPNEGSRLEYDGANRIWRLKWWGKSGRTYFIQHTDDLKKGWQWLPFVEAGNGSVREWGFNSSGNRFFIRLKYSDIPTNNPSLADFDGDRVSNLDEVTQGTNPLLAADTDSNGLPDDWETFYFGAIGQNPNADPDGDGLTNLLEYQIGTKASGLDENWDGLPDGFDTDGDGLPDGFEYRYRSRLRPTVWDNKNLDPDGDGITDKWEAFYGFDPTVADGGADPDGDGLRSAEEIAGGSSPVDADIDADGLNDKQEREQGTSPWVGDTDYDSLRDGWEVANGFNPKAWNDPASDGDNDGLSDWWEARQATNPRVADTDGDGTNDGTEVANNTDPTDPEWGGSPPAAPSEIRETVNGDGSITYTWKDNSNNEEGFRIWRKTEGGTWQQVGSVPANATSLTIPAP